MRRRTDWGTRLLAVGALLCVGGLRAASSDTPQQAFRTLRRDFLLVMPVAPYRDGAVRQEVSAYLSRLNRFLKDPGTTPPDLLAAAYYFRGRVQMKLRRSDRARADLECALDRLQGGAVLAAGTPSAADVQVFRAFTFVDAGNEKIMAELEAIPAAAGKASYHEVGSLVSEWAEALMDADMDGLALRALQFIKQHDLWHDEGDDPQPRIHRLQYKMGQGGAATEASATVAPAVAP